MFECVYVSRKLGARVGGGGCQVMHIHKLFFLDFPPFIPHML